MSPALQAIARENERRVRAMLERYDHQRRAYILPLAQPKRGILFHLRRFFGL